MSVLVVGASGYIGQSLFAAAALAGQARGTTRTASGGCERLDLGEPQAFDYASIAAGDSVFITAAISAPDVCARDPAYARAVNVEGTALLIERLMARKARVVFFSSDTVYGECDNPVDESSPCRPAGDYAHMKHEVEMHFLGKPLFKSIRLSHVFSQADKFTRYLAGCAARDEEAELFHPFYRAVIHRDDVVAGALALTRRWDEFTAPVINFGGPQILARTDCADTLRATALPTLRYRVNAPEPEFFRNRPRVIAMHSPLLEALLGRPVRTLRQAAQIEFHCKEP